MFLSHLSNNSIIENSIGVRLGHMWSKLEEVVSYHEQPFYILNGEKEVLRALLLPTSFRFFLVAMDTFKSKYSRG